MYVLQQEQLLSEFNLLPEESTKLFVFHAITVQQKLYLTQYTKYYLTIICKLAIKHSDSWKIFEALSPILVVYI